MAGSSQSVLWGEEACVHNIHQYIPDSVTAEAHSLETWTPPLTLKPTPTQKYWVIYIHGGAWWRPMITASSFGLTVKHLLGNPNTRKDIAGFASLNYRLSTPPPLPQFAEFTEPGNEGRNVKHPAHLNDVVAGLKFLQEKYGFSENYVLVGHSCGATLAFQIPAEKGEGLKGPVGVLGVEGIYDLGKLRDDHSAVPMYQYFTESAFGIDEEAWRVASPTTQGSGFAWEKAKVVALAQSDGDELVDGEQRDVMWDFLRKNAKEGRKDELIQLVGKHDQIWREEDGKGKTQLGVSIETVLKLLI